MDTEPGGTASLDSGPVGAELTDTECRMESWAQAAVSVPPLLAHSTPRGARDISGVELSSLELERKVKTSRAEPILCLPVSRGVIWPTTRFCYEALL